MTHHHDTVIEMAKIAQDRGQDPFIKGLAEDIVSTQEREMAEMKKIYTRLLGGELKPDPGEIEEMNTFRTEKYGAPVPEMEMKGGGAEHEGH